MMYSNYETELMSAEESKKFAAWFKKEIGTEFERNEDGSCANSDRSYFVCFELTQSELQRVKDKLS